MTEDETLERVLADSRVAPDYTMGALARRTGVPSDTIRSWERRYGFPKPRRTDTNRRRYSERDIASVTWLREQTEFGQGISEAISMLKSRISESAYSSASSQSRDQMSVAPSKPSPEDILMKKLRQGDTEAAQLSWDKLTIALSPEAIMNALLRLYLGLQQTAPGTRSFTTDRAHAFLLRKATVLLDLAGPDAGKPASVLVTADPNDPIPVTLLAAVLARSGHRVVMPFLLVASLTTVDAVHDTAPDIIVLVGTSDEQAASFSRLVPGVDIHRWNPSKKEESADSLAHILRILENR